MATLGERIKELRTDKKLTQSELASICGIARSTLSLYEIDRSEPDDNIKKSLATFFDVSIDYLCGYSNIRKHENLYYSPADLNLVKIPVLSLLDDESQKYIFVDSKMAENGSYFFCQITDDLMINARIITNDLIYVKKQSTVDSGDIAVLLIDKNRISLRRTIKTENSLIFLSEHPHSHSSFTNLDLKSGKVEILGKVISVTFKI